MEKYSNQQRIQVVKFFYQNQGPIIQTQRAYYRHVQVKDVSSESAIKNLIRRFEKQGTVADLPRSGRPRNVRSDETREQVRESVNESPCTSIRRRSRQLRISRTPLQRILISLRLCPAGSTAKAPRLWIGDPLCCQNPGIGKKPPKFHPEFRWLMKPTFIWMGSSTKLPFWGLWEQYTNEHCTL